MERWSEQPAPVSLPGKRGFHLCAGILTDASTWAASSAFIDWIVKDGLWVIMIK